MAVRLCVLTSEQTPSQTDRQTNKQKKRPEARTDARDETREQTTDNGFRARGTSPQTKDCEQHGLPARPPAKPCQRSAWRHLESWAAELDRMSRDGGPKLHCNLCWKELQVISSSHPVCVHNPRTEDDASRRRPSSSRRATTHSAWTTRAIRRSRSRRAPAATSTSRRRTA